MNIVSRTRPSPWWRQAWVSVTTFAEAVETSHDGRQNARLDRLEQEITDLKASRNGLTEPASKDLDSKRL